MIIMKSTKSLKGTKPPELTVHYGMVSFSCSSYAKGGLCESNQSVLYWIGTVGGLESCDSPLRNPTFMQTPICTPK